MAYKEGKGETGSITILSFLYVPFLRASQSCRHEWFPDVSLPMWECMASPAPAACN